MYSTTTCQPETLETLLTMQPTEIDQLPWQPVPDCPGVRVKDLWRCGSTHDALISYAPGSGTPGKPHPGVRHHTGTAHPIGDIAAEGCLLLQMHHPLRP